MVIFWFQSNYMKFNTHKCHYLISGSKYEQMWAKMGEHKICKSTDVKPLAVAVDNKLNFGSHSISLKAN